MRLPTRTILNAVLATVRAIDKATDPDVCEYDFDTVKWLEEIRMQCGEFRWAYPLRLREVAAHRVDRCKPLLSGPLFTSAKHPWLFIEERWLEPIAQINLAVAGAAGGVALGDGMLQLWMGQVDGYLRLIPAEDIDPDALISIPDEVAASPSSRFNYRPPVFSKVSSRYSGVSPEWLQTSFVITGYGKKVLSPPPLLDTALTEYAIPRLKPRLASTLGNLIRLIENREWPSTDPQYFGNFDLIQYDVLDRDPTLLALESDNKRFMWGDSGNAQIFYNLKRDGVDRFTFDWSCH